MSFLSFVFGKNNLSSYQWPLSSDEVEDLITRTSIVSLTTEEEKLVESVLKEARGSDGRISMAQIDESLQKLQNKNKISENDKEAILKIFKNHFAKKSK